MKISKPHIVCLLGVLIASVVGGELLAVSPDISSAPQAEVSGIHPKGDIPYPFPTFTTTGSSPFTGGCFLFALSPYLVVLDHEGDPLFFREVPYGVRNFSAQQSGPRTYFDHASGEFISINRNYEVTDSFSLAGIEPADFHSFVLLNSKHRLMMATCPEKKDMSTVIPGGDPQATVTYLMLQELDSLDQVVFSWDSRDHFSITDADSALVDLTASVIDYVHGNHFVLTPDGNYLLTSRNLSEVTKIDRTTGDILWRLGGKNNQFTGDPVDFRALHSATLLDSTHLLVFDNGLSSRLLSRATLFKIDQSARTIYREVDYRHDPDLFSANMGNALNIDGKYVLTGWGKNNGSTLCTLFDTAGTPLMNILSADIEPQWSYQVSWSNVMDTLVERIQDTLNMGTVSVGDTALPEVKFVNTSGGVMDYTGWTCANPDITCETDSLKGIGTGDTLTLRLQYIPSSAGQLAEKAFFYFKPSGVSASAELIVRKMYLEGNGLSTGLRRAEKPVSLHLYPNPVAQWLFIDTGTDFDKIIIRNVLGEIVSSLYPVKGRIKINMAPLPDGIYLVSFFPESGEPVIKKVIKSGK